jgi:hypothetical protein
MNFEGNLHYRAATIRDKGYLGHCEVLLCFEQACSPVRTYVYLEEESTGVLIDEVLNSAPWMTSVVCCLLLASRPTSLRDS